MATNIKDCNAVGNQLECSTLFHKFMVSASMMNASSVERVHSSTVPQVCDEYQLEAISRGLALDMAITCVHGNEFTDL